MNGTSWGYRSTWIVMLAGALALSGASEAKAQLYVFSQSTSPYVPLAGGTPVNPSSFDDGAATVMLPFAFTYYGTSYTGMNVGVNGIAAFANSCTGSPGCIMFTENCMNNLCSRGNM